MPYAIAAGHDYTAEAAEEILLAGGNAADAAIAAFVMTWVCEPCMASAGGGGFANIYTSSRKSYLLDFFCQTPRRKEQKDPEFFPIEVNFGDSQELFHIGAASVAVPGSVAGVFALYHRFGSLPLSLLFEPAIEAAKAGVAINRFQHLDFRLLTPILKHREAGRALFFEDGQLKKEGTILPMPQMADYLDYLWREGERAFYQGEIAQKIAEQQAMHRGYLQAQDLADYRVQWQQNQSITLQDLRILCNPTPHPGGSILAQALQAFSDYIGTNVSPADFAAQLANALLTIRRPDKPNNSKQGSTTHFSIVDGQGNAVSITASNGEGSGYFIPGTDIQLNNMLGEEALLPEGFHNWPTNTRLGSMMTPSIVTDKNGQLQLVTGSSGAGRIPYTIAQVIYRNQVLKQPIDQSVNGARMHLNKNTIELEPGFEQDAMRIPASIQQNHWNAPNLYFGGAHSVQVAGQHLMAAPDRRRDGVVRVKND